MRLERRDQLRDGEEARVDLLRWCSDTVVRITGGFIRWMGGGEKCRVAVITCV